MRFIIPLSCPCSTQNLHINSCFYAYVEVTLFRLVGGPESEIVSEKLHDECAIFVALFGQRIKLGYGVIKCLGEEREGEWRSVCVEKGK